MFHLLGVMFIYYIKYFVFDIGIFIINLHALFSLFYMYVIFRP